MELKKLTLLELDALSNSLERICIFYENEANTKQTYGNGFKVTNQNVEIQEITKQMAFYRDKYHIVLEEIKNRINDLK